MSILKQSIGQAKGRAQPLTTIRNRGRERSFTDPFARFSTRYSMALQNYLAQPEEAFLQLAYELGRQAVAEGIGLLNLWRIHNAAAERCGKANGTKKPAATETFFMEALSPFEATHRGFRETNAKLSELNATLAKRNHELAAINFALKQEIEERKRTVEALRQSKDHYRVLFNEARVMQENLRHLSNRMLSVQEEERKRISRELHDEVGQALTAANVQLAVIRKSPEQAAEKIAAAQELLEQTMGAVHGFARELRPAMLDDLGLAPALRSYIHAFSQRTGLAVRLTAIPLVENLGSEEKMVLYRVVQEGLTNVARHAQATRVEVTLRKMRAALRMEITDDGKAFSVAEQEHNPQRLGLLGMQERVRLVNGTFHIDSRPGKGTTLRVDLPLPAKKSLYEKD